MPVGTSNEFQRADVAPIETSGEGILDASDMSQIRRYIVGLDPQQVAAGPTQPIGRIEELFSWIRELFRYSGDREIKLRDASGSNGRLVNVSVDSRALGDATATSFSIEFDPKLLKIAAISPGIGMSPNAVITVNTDNAAFGRIGVLIDSDQPLMADDGQMLAIAFEIAADAEPGESIVRFTDSLANRALADRLGDHLGASYLDGKVTILAASSDTTGISGRVLTADGRGIRGVVVRLTDGNGVIRRATTGVFGWYSFQDIEPGRTYVVGAESKRFRFSSIAVTPATMLSDVDLIAVE